LDRRRIEPSPGSWERVAGQLSAQGRIPAGRWKAYALAAGFAGILLLALWPLEKDEMEPADMRSVEREGPRKQGHPPQSGPQGGIDVPPSNAGQAPLREADSEEITLENKVYEQEFTIPGQTVASRDSLPGDALDKGARDLILEKAREVVAQVAQLEDQHQQLTQGEVDSLLRVAQRQILQEKIFRDSGSVDAMALLAEVEEELHSPLRDQLFEALKAGYFKLRTAVADRNR